MRPALALVALVVLAAAGCSRPASTASSGNEAAEPPAPPAAEPTEAQRQAALAALPAPYNRASLDNGQSRFALCRSCHTINQGGSDMTGPNLFGVVGRQAGSKEGFNYSDGLRTAGFTWDGPHLDTWLSGPSHMIPGTRMTFAGMPDPTDRRDVIAYLMVEGAPPPPASSATNSAGSTNSASGTNAAP